MSPGKSSASCFPEKSLQLSFPEDEECVVISSPPNNYQCRNYTSVRDLGMEESLVGCGGTLKFSADESCLFFNPIFPNVNVGYCGFIAKSTGDLSGSSGVHESAGESLTSQSKYFI